MKRGMSGGGEERIALTNLSTEEGAEEWVGALITNGRRGEMCAKQKQRERRKGERHRPENEHQLLTLRRCGKTRVLRACVFRSVGVKADRTKLIK